MNKQEVTALIEKIALHSAKCRECGVIGRCELRPILLGDVLEKGIKPKIDGIRLGTELMRLWGYCGFSRSLQEIVEASGWTERVTGGSDNYWTVEELKSKDADALLTFLKNLFE